MRTLDPLSHWPLTAFATLNLPGGAQGGSTLAILAAAVAKAWALFHAQPAANCRQISLRPGLQFLRVGPRIVSMREG